MNASKDPKKVQDVLTSAKEWFEKHEFILGQIEALEKLKEYPIIRISILLLKAQVIEFELKQLISKLDAHYRFSNSSDLIKRKIRTPKELSTIKGLGGIISILNEYESTTLNKLVGNLNNFNTIRINFVHYMLDPDTNLEDIKDSSEIGIKLATDILEEFKKTNALLNEHDPLKKS